jgi:glycosyltransferase involved in cell wall biosynthesis
MKTEALISVCIITYNQQDFIRQAIESILSQQTDYSFEVNVFNDASTDNTGEVINDIIKTHPKGAFIRHHVHSQNIGLAANYIYSIRNSTGKYIAICEGDDYWNGKNKLQKQVDFLEKNTDYFLCFHKAVRLNVVQNLYSVYPSTDQTDFSDRTFFYLSTIPMASVVFRNTEKIYFNDKSVQLDFNLLCSLLSLGKAHMINEVMSVYRVHKKATTFQRSAQDFKLRLSCLLAESKYKGFNKVVKKEIGRLYLVHVLQLLNGFPGQTSLTERINYLVNALIISKTSNNYLNDYKMIIRSIL